MIEQLLTSHPPQRNRSRHARLPSVRQNSHYSARLFNITASDQPGFGYKRGSGSEGLTFVNKWGATA